MNVLMCIKRSRTDINTSDDLMIGRVEITSLGNNDHSNSGATPLKCFNLAVLLPNAISIFTKDCFGFLVQEKARIEKKKKRKTSVGYL